MMANRKVGHAPRVTKVARDLGEIGGCIGCKHCEGLCRALIDAIVLPDVVLSRASQ